MDAMLLHLDEEFTNRRQGHDYALSYSPEDLAFLLQFYSLFFDRVIVPANFLTDSNLIPSVLASLRVTDPDSALVTETGAFHILWDEHRFPYASFAEFVDSFASTHNLDVSLRSLDTSRVTASLCDRYLKGKILRRSVSADIYNDASIRLMNDLVFNTDVNQAVRADHSRTLAACVADIQSRGGVIGYGRDFFYTIFGYGRTAADEALARRYEDIVSVVRNAHDVNLQPLFLTAVDYASHTVKAAIAARGLGTEVAALLPFELQRVFRRPQTNEIFYLVDRSVTLALDKSHTYLLDRDRIIGLTAVEAFALKTSAEYRDFRELVDSADRTLESRRQMTPQETAALGSAFDTYLSLIERNLNPTRKRTDRAFELATRIVQTRRGFSILGAITRGAKLAMAAANPGIGLALAMIELFTVHDDTPEKSVERARDVITHHRQLPIEGFQLGRNVNVSLFKDAKS